jgi:pimeloyl-ACP methyl ester carboxylesterase
MPERVARIEDLSHTSIEILNAQLCISPSDVFCEETGSGAPVLLVHGNPSTHTLWSPIVPELARCRRVVTVDLPGFGASPSPAVRGGFALDRVARTLLEMMSLRGYDRFDLVGHSLGGAVAATMTALRPERIRTLTLITPMSDRVPPVARFIAITVLRELARLAWKLAPTPMRKSVLLRFHRMTSGAAFNERRAAQVLQELEGTRTIDSIVGFMSNVDYAAYRSTLRTLSGRRGLPLLMIGCRRDNVIPYQQFVGMQTLLLPDRLRVFDEGGHLPMWQFPREVASAIVEFLDAQGEAA